MSELIRESTINLIKCIFNNAILTVKIVIILALLAFFDNSTFDKLEARLDRIEKLLETKRGSNE